MKASLFRNFAGSLMAIILIFLGGNAEAATVSLKANSQGWYRPEGDGLTNGLPDVIANTFTGIFDNTEYRSYFTFDLGELRSPIENAKLQLFQEFYFSGDGSEGFTVFDVTYSNAMVTSRPDAPLAEDIFNDLGSGTVYGSGVIAGTPGWQPIGTWLEITLNENALAAMNEARLTTGEFSIGIALNTLGGTEFLKAEGVRFSDNASDPAAMLQVQEVESVPEPITLLGSVTAFGFGLALRKRSKEMNITGGKS